MTHPYAHEVQVGTRWSKVPYGHHLPLYDRHGWVTHTVVIGYDQNPEGPDDPCTFSDDPTWPGILAACGFCTKSEARRRGFHGEASEGFSETRVAANIVLYVWRKAQGKLTV
jgi:hypothetical protein